jgi:hypothetical protein
MADCRSSFTKAAIAGSGFAFGAMAVFPFPVNLLRPQRDSVPRSLATPRGGCNSKAMARSLSKKRAHHAKKRLQQLRGIIHELPADILDRCNLRQLSYATKRCGGPCQLLLPPAEDGRRDLNCHASEPPAQPVTGPSWTELTTKNTQGQNNRVLRANGTLLKLKR